MRKIDSEKNLGKCRMPSGQKVNSYEEFLNLFEKGNEATKREFFKQIQFAQKEAERLRVKNRRRYWRKKEAQEAAQAAAQEATETQE